MRLPRNTITQDNPQQTYRNAVRATRVPVGHPVSMTPHSRAILNGICTHVVILHGHAVITMESPLGHAMPSQSYTVTIDGPIALHDLLLLEPVGQRPLRQALEEAIQSQRGGLNRVSKSCRKVVKVLDLLTMLLMAKEDS